MVDSTRIAAGAALRTARTCYDHLAGRLGVALADALTERGLVTLSADGGEVTAAGQRFLEEFGARPAAGRRVFCRPCLDWSERRPHLAGRVGAALACRCFELGWIARERDTRAVAITQAGRAGFRERFGISPAVLIMPGRGPSGRRTGALERGGWRIGRAVPSLECNSPR